VPLKVASPLSNVLVSEITMVVADALHGAEAVVCADKGAAVSSTGSAAKMQRNDRTTAFSVPSKVRPSKPEPVEP
jgi:hypothetical protein